MLNNKFISCIVLLPPTIVLLPVYRNINLDSLFSGTACWGRQDNLQGDLQFFFKIFIQTQPWIFISKKQKTKTESSHSLTPRHRTCKGILFTNEWMSLISCLLQLFFSDVLSRETVKRQTILSHDPSWVAVSATHPPSELEPRLDQPFPPIRSLAASPCHPTRGGLHSYHHPLTSTWRQTQTGPTSGRNTTESPAFTFG